MNREIKFRIWDSVQEIMHYPGEPGSEYLISLVGMIIDDAVPEMGQPVVNYRCKAMQFTGLKDKNGKEIYEGDICSYTIKSTGLTIILKAAVEWDKKAAMFVFSSSSLDPSTTMPIWNVHSTEILGNVYENPDLLLSEQKLRIEW